ncbi:hypothetical protein GJ744_010343 [Endocarpon pusillum]|uniref:Phenylalanine--tRNA ligase, mitochondrial n=1 Tax=Endocarpon pusillum TaxID=364733 RepID=A0A8H7E316_9EURO|nr:hypothetical protein GJ744_010343 [Endocarpon pusillum]
MEIYAASPRTSTIKPRDSFVHSFIHQQANGGLVFHVCQVGLQEAVSLSPCLPLSISPRLPPMRLLFTGRAVRASRKFLSPVTPLRWNSTAAAASEDAPTNPRPVIQRTRRGYNSFLFRTIDISPEGTEGTTTEDDAFNAPSHQRPARNHTFSGEVGSAVVISQCSYRTDSTSNLSPSILKLLDRRLYAQRDHPIAITRKLIESVFTQPTFQHYIASNPVVSTAANFDALGFPADHPGRSTTDSYYVNKDHVLRTHTSAYQHAAFQAMKQKHETPYGYTICADVFRRDSIDRSHFPVFHQMEGARLWRHSKTDSQGFPISYYQGYLRRMEIIRQSLGELARPPVDVDDPNPHFHEVRNPKQPTHQHQEIRLVASHLKRTLELLVAKVFDAAKQAAIASGHLDANGAQEPLKVRWVEAYFPFTSPSYELEVHWQGEWLELLGCGVVQQALLDDAGVGDRIGWAWGIGIERLAMILFGIPDIRLFWSEDPRFLNQFRAGQITRFEPFSKYPACYKDVAFWIGSSAAAAAAAAASPPAEEHHHKTLGDTGSDPGLAAAAGGNSTHAAAAPTETQPTAFHENDVMEIVRDVAGSLVEDVKLVDEFVHPTSGRKSLCYRINYRSLERTLTNEETNWLHREVARRLVADLGVELR